MAVDARLQQLIALCQHWPEVACEPKGDHGIFRVKGKVFAYFMNNHHGDGIVSISCKSALGEHLDRVRREPERFYLPAYIGPRGWFGLRLDRGKIHWDEVESIMRQSYRLVAPKKLLLQFDDVVVSSVEKAKPKSKAKSKPKAKSKKK